MVASLQRVLIPEMGLVLGLVLVVVAAGLFLARSELTGQRVLIVVVSFFCVIIAVNYTLASRAIGTFPGLEVKNSYVASQGFDRERAAQNRLGWTLTPEYDVAAHELRLFFADAGGLPAPIKDLQVLIGRATAAREDKIPAFTRRAGVHVSNLELAPGKWMMQVRAQLLRTALLRRPCKMRFRCRSARLVLLCLRPRGWPRLRRRRCKSRPVWCCRCRRPIVPPVSRPWKTA
jgi:nitrogen fixation protein FixH